MEESSRIVSFIVVLYVFSTIFHPTVVAFMPNQFYTDPIIRNPLDGTPLTTDSSDGNSPGSLSFNNNLPPTTSSSDSNSPGSVSFNNNLPPTTSSSDSNSPGSGSFNSNLPLEDPPRDPTNQVGISPFDGNSPGSVSFNNNLPLEDPTHDTTDQVPGSVSFNNNLPLNDPSSVSFNNNLPLNDPSSVSFNNNLPLNDPSSVSFNNNLPLNDPHTRTDQVRIGFYKDVCPRVEQIVSKVVKKYARHNTGLAGGLIRLFFHDCFVTGCDASILLDETPSGEMVEKDSPANDNSIRGLEIIDKIKAKLEEKCPGVVSCADILAFAARDAAVSKGLLHYPVAAGRRDGLSSLAKDTMILPRPNHLVGELTEIFASRGLNQEDLVILSGAHSLGYAHCSTFQNRIHGYNSTKTHDPSLNPLYASHLKKWCPKSAIPKDGSLGKVMVPLDSISPTRLDNMYYVGLKEGKGLLESDQTLMNDEYTRKLVILMAQDGVLWAKKFGQAMQKVGMMGVLTGNQGEIRRKCRRVN